MSDRPMAKEPTKPEHIAIAEGFAREMSDRFGGSELRQMSHAIRDKFRVVVEIAIAEAEYRVIETNEQISILKDCLEDI